MHCSNSKQLTDALTMRSIIQIIINNYKTSTGPISWKRIELSGAHRIVVGQTHSLCTRTMMERKTMLFDDLTCSESEFQRIKTATEKARFRAWGLNLGTNNKRKPDERNSLGFSKSKSLIGNSAEVGNVGTLTREPVKRFQKWDKMGKPRRPCDNPS